MSYKISGLSRTSLLVELRTRRKILKWKANPIAAFSANLKNTLSLALQTEATEHSSSSNNILRESLLNFPGLGPGTQRTVLESQVIIDNNTSTQTSNSIRERDRYSISISSIIHVVSHTYSLDPGLRNAILTGAQARGLKLPRLMSEAFKRTRLSSHANFEIVPVLNKDSWDAFLNANPNLENTIWDYKFLNSSSGLQTVLDFCSRLQNSEGNYIDFVDATIQNFPNWDAGLTTTICGIICDTSTSINDRDVYALPGLNYPGAEVTSTHPGDVNLLDAHFVDDSNKLYTLTHDSSYKITVQGSTVTLVTYLVNRANSTIVNPHGKKNTKAVRDSNKKDALASNISVPDTSGNKIRSVEPEAFKTREAFRLSQVPFGDYLILVPNSSLGASLVKQLLNGPSMTPRRRKRS